MIKSQLRQAFLEALRDYTEQRPLSSLSKEDLGYARSKEANEYIRCNDFAFLSGLIFDQSIQSSSAWQAPYELSQRINDLSPNTLSRMKEDDLKEIIAGKPALHRYPSSMAKNLIATSQIIMKSYNGVAGNIWKDIDNTHSLKKRLMELKGIGEKKASLGMLMLIRDRGVKIDNTDELGMAYDVHLNRVLKRSGHFAELGNSDINEEFKEFYGDNYSEIGTYIWLIGREACHSKSPDCMLCPLSMPCKKLIF